MSPSFTSTQTESICSLYRLHRDSDCVCWPRYVTLLSGWFTTSHMVYHELEWFTISHNGLP